MEPPCPEPLIPDLSPVFTYLVENLEMIRLLAKLRSMNLTKRNFPRYLQYAIGEIILIIIGILIALSLNEWSIKKEKQEAFDLALSQVYTDLHKERGWYEYMIAGYQRSTGLLERELEGELNIPTEEIPKYLYYFNSIDLADYDLGNEPLLQTMQDNITSNDQRDLVNKISGHYALWVSWNEVVNKSRITFLDALIREYELPFVERYTLFTLSVFHRTEKEFTALETERAMALRSDPRYLTAIRSSLNRNLDLIARFGTKRSTIMQLIAIIEAHDPEIPVTFSDVRITGPALSGSEKSFVSMTPVNSRRTQWQTNAQMADGTFRFVDGVYSIPSWGKDRTGNNVLLFHGDGIPVSAGEYEITVDFAEMSYSIREKGGD